LSLSNSLIHIMERPLKGCCLSLQNTYFCKNSEPECTTATLLLYETSHQKIRPPKTYGDIVILVSVSCSIFFRFLPSLPISRPTKLLCAKIFKGISSVL